MMTMDRRFSRESSRESKGSIALQKKIVDSQRPHTAKNVPDLTDFMNDMFFGTMDDDKKACNLTGCHSEDEEESFDDSTRSSSSELPQEWLDAARRMVACVNSFELDHQSSVPGRLSSASTLDRRDPLSRSARRDIPSITIPKSGSPTSSNHPLIAMPQFQTAAAPNQSNDRSSPLLDPPALNLPPRQSSYRKSRFQTEPPATTPQGIPVTSRRTFKLSSIEKVDLESLMMEGKLSILVVGQDDEVGSQCTVLTDNYCEDAYDLLQTPVLKKLLVNY
ncbi:hypothetical protein OIU76_022261 [Salix suchowensis]|nr:hypothetical protein OIU76_022261 [Salix suchowensis]